MKLVLDEIFESQKILDSSIHQKHGTTYAKVFNELKLALAVELGELANEVRCFKFWSVKGPSDNETILEEYVDGIHFICSLSIYKKVKSSFIIPQNIKRLNKQAITKSFNQLFTALNSLSNANGIKNWFTNYLILGYQLGFNYSSIRESYFKKNQINFKRQKENY